VREAVILIILATLQTMLMNAEKKVHHGRNIKRLREMIGMKQDALALELGEDWTQQRISLLEQKETVDDPLLQQVAGALKMPVEAIKNFDEEGAINIITSSITNNDNSSVYGHYNFNPLDKVIELYERLIKEKEEKIAWLQESKK
jgi:transcriptional regulator with XRE-family HTH domain